MDFVSQTDEEAIQAAAFANVTYRLAQWSFEAGTRVEYDKDTLWVYPTNASPNTTLVQQSVDNTVNLPRGSASYHFNPNLMAYASIARGFTPGGVFNGMLGLTEFRPETTLNYELGIKETPFDNRVTYDVAAFYIDYRDRIFQQQTVEPPNPNIKSNLGDSHNYGMDRSAKVRVTHDLALSAAGGSTIAKWYNATYVDPVTHMPVSLNGLTAPYTPIYQASVSADWERSLTDRIVLGVHAEDSFQGRSHWDPQNLRSQSAYSIANFSVRWGVGSHWTFRGNISNAFDTRCNTNYFYGPALGAPYDVAKLGRPRLITGSVTWTL